MKDGRQKEGGKSREEEWYNEGRVREGRRREG
jgi:hypothetical protein